MNHFRKMSGGLFVLDSKFMGTVALMSASILLCSNLCFAETIGTISPAQIGATPHLQTTIEKQAIEAETDSQGEVRIPLVFKFQFTSNQLRAGDAIQAEVAQDVYHGDTLVFKKGAEGIVYVKSSKRRHIFGGGGSICLGEGEITDEFGVQHIINFSENSAKIKGNSMIAPKLLPALGYFYPPMALLSFYGLMKGDDAVIPAGKVFFATTPAGNMTNVSNVSFVKNNVQNK